MNTQMTNTARCINVTGADEDLSMLEYYAEEDLLTSDATEVALEVERLVTCPLQEIEESVGEHYHVRIITPTGGITVAHLMDQVNPDEQR